jgi:hypothetical protein
MDAGTETPLLLFVGICIYELHGEKEKSKRKEVVSDPQRPVIAGRRLREITVVMHSWISCSGTLRTYKGMGQNR